MNDVSRAAKKRLIGVDNFQLKKGTRVMKKLYVVAIQDGSWEQRSVKVFANAAKAYAFCREEFGKRALAYPESEGYSHLFESDDDHVNAEIASGCEFRLNLKVFTEFTEPSAQIGEAQKKVWVVVSDEDDSIDSDLLRTRAQIKLFKAENANDEEHAREVAEYSLWVCDFPGASAVMWTCEEHEYGMHCYMNNEGKTGWAYYSTAYCCEVID